MKKQNFYTQDGWQGENYDRSLSCKELTAKIREYLKKEFPDCKFSVTKETGSLYWSINLSLMAAPQEVLNYSMLSEYEKEGQYVQVNHYSKIDERLTEYGNKILKKAVTFIDSYNYNDSDAMIDYFDTNFYLHVNVGKWDKPFQIIKKKENKETPAKVEGVQIIDYSDKAIAVIGDTKPIKEILKNAGGRFNFRLTCGAGWIFPKSKKEELLQLI